MRERSVVCGFVFFAATMAAVGAAWGSTLTIDSYALSGTGTVDITAIGSTDWVLPCVDQKSSGTAIQTFDGYMAPLLASGSNPSTPAASVPLFSYTDGVAGSGTSVWENYNVGGMTSVIQLPAGSGTVTAWLFGWAADPAGFSAAFADATSVTHAVGGAGAGPEKVVLSYATATAQSLTLLTNAGGGGSMFAVAVSTVPEPGTLVLLATGLIGLLCYAWRKQR